MTKIHADGDFGRYSANEGTLDQVREEMRDLDLQGLREYVESRADHEAPWSRTVLEIMLAEWRDAEDAMRRQAEINSQRHAAGRQG